MTGQYEVLVEALTAHAKRTNSIADRVTQAVDAVREVSLPTDAYGQFCQELPAMLNPLQQLGIAALSSSAKRLKTTAAAVRHTAEDYAEIDDANALELLRARGIG